MPIVVQETHFKQRNIPVKRRELLSSHYSLLQLINTVLPPLLHLSHQPVWSPPPPPPPPPIHFLCSLEEITKPELLYRDSTVLTKARHASWAVWIVFVVLINVPPSLLLCSSTTPQTDQWTKILTFIFDINWRLKKCRPRILTTIQSQFWDKDVTKNV